MPELPSTSDCTIVVVSGGLGWMRGAKPGFGANCASRASFSTGEAVLKAHRGVRALHACVLSLPRGVLEPSRTSDCTFAVVSGGLGSIRSEAPSPFVVVTELCEQDFQLERPT